MHHECSVRSRLEVELDPVAGAFATERGCEPEPGERVLHRVSRHSAVSDDEGSSGRGKAWGSHVDPLLELLKLPDITHPINNVDNVMCPLCTMLVDGASEMATRWPRGRPLVAVRPQPGAGLTNRVRRRLGLKRS